MHSKHELYYYALVGVINQSGCSLCVKEPPPPPPSISKFEVRPCSVFMRRPSGPSIATEWFVKRGMKNLAHPTYPLPMHAWPCDLECNQFHALRCGYSCTNGCAETELETWLASEISESLLYVYCLAIHSPSLTAKLQNGGNEVETIFAVAFV